MPTNGMTIDSLNIVSSLTAQDEVPVWDKEASGEHTRKITAQNMANSVKSLASLPNTTEMNTAIAQSTANEVSATVTYKVGAISANNNGFIGTKGNLYICNLQIMINGTVNAGEHDAATVSIAPKHNISGVIIRNADSSLHGSFSILANGLIYMYFTSTITTTSPELFYLTACGIAES